MTDPTQKTAFDDRAPADERFDAQAELQAIYKPLESALIPAPAVKAVVDYINQSMEEQDLAKASRAIIVPYFEGEKTRRGKGQTMQSVTLDKFLVVAQGNFLEKTSGISLEAMKMLVDQTPILAAVVGTRIRQIGRFCGPSEDGGQGFAIRHINLEHQVEDAEKISMGLMQKFFQHCGWEFNPRKRKRLRRDNFATFMSKLTRDTLSMDAAAIETVFARDRSMGIDGIHAVDGSTIRLCDEEGYEGDDEFFAVQVVQGQVRTAYTLDDLIYEPRNARTDVRSAGYGVGEPELLIRVVTGLLNAMTLNIKGFSENSIPRGILHLCGDYAAEDIQSFKRYWNQMVRGINNAWALPVLVSKDKESRAELSPINAEFNEMYFSKWMTFLTSIVCAIYGMSPDEINFESFSAQRSSLSGTDTEEKLAESKDKGLKPLMSYFENLFTDYIVGEYDSKYVFRWVGMDEKDSEKEWEAKKLILTWNEMRAENGYDAIEGKMGDIPLNPSLIGPWMQENMQQQQPQEDFGGAPPFAKDSGEPGAGPQQSRSGAGSPQGGAGTAPEAQNGSSEASGGGKPFGKAFPTVYTI